MRRGQVFRRCSKCGEKVEAKRCSRGHDGFSWAFVVDVGAAGARRDQRQKGGFATKAAALEAMSELQKAKADGTHVESSRLTVGRYLEQWLAARTAIRDNTRRDYQGSITKHILPRLGDVPLQTLTRLQVKGLYQQLATAGLVEKSVHNVHICLRKALQDALEDGLVRRNIADRAHAKPKDRPEMKTWSADELATFLASTTKDPDLALYQTAAATGMRRGELLGLRWRDVDLESTRLNVRQQVSRHGKGWGFGPPKSAKSVRTIDLDPETVGLLREERERQLFERRAWGDGYRSDLDLVFCRPDGSTEDPDVVGRRFVRRVRAVAGLPTIGLHGLRHTHATLLLEEGVDIKTVSERLGHDSVQTTLDLYAHVTPKMRANAAARFGAVLDRARAAGEETVASGRT
jgi:integrase